MLQHKMIFLDISILPTFVATLWGRPFFLFEHDDTSCTLFGTEEQSADLNHIQHLWDDCDQCLIAQHQCGTSLNTHVAANPCSQVPKSGWKSSHYSEGCYSSILIQLVGRKKKTLTYIKQTRKPKFFFCYSWQWSVPVLLTHPLLCLSSIFGAV